MDPAELQQQLNRFEAACRQDGLKLTHQRMEIYRELAASTDHPNAEILHRRLTRKIPMLSLDTVYRTLTTLWKHGLIQKVETIESQARFEVVFKRHHHLICRHCREIMDFQWPSIDDVKLPDDLMHWGKIDSRNVVIYGICKHCSMMDTTENSNNNKETSDDRDNQTNP